MPAIFVRLLYGFVFLCFLISYAIYRWINNRRTDDYAASLIKALDATPEAANELAVDHQNLYAKISKGENIVLQERLAYIPRDQVILEKYQVIGAYSLRNDGVLLVTICENKEPGETRGREVTKKYSFNFVARHNATTGEIEVCSDYYALLADRFLRQDFAKYLAQFIEQNN